MSHVCSAGYGCTCDAVDAIQDELTENEGVMRALRRQRDEAQAATAALLASLEATLLAHRPYGLDCKCDRPINSDADWAKHVVGVLGEDTER